MPSEVKPPPPPPPVRVQVEAIVQEVAYENGRGEVRLQLDGGEQAIVLPLQSLAETRELGGRLYARVRVAVEIQP